MREGLLWYDDTPDRILADKIMPAVRRYREKFGVAPNVCFVHVSELDSEQQVDGVRVSSRPTVLRHHFWIGREEVNVEAAAEVLRTCSLTSRCDQARRLAEPLTPEQARALALALESELSEAQR